MVDDFNLIIVYRSTSINIIKRLDFDLFITIHLGLQPIWEFLKTIETRKNSKTNFQLMTRFIVEQLLAGTTLYWKVF